MSDDLVQQLRELASRTHDINDHTVLHLSADEIERLRARLSSPQAEDVRREALEEAVKAVVLASWMHAGKDAYSQGMDAGARLQACVAAIRALASKETEG